jgi:hypothetical protein
MKMRAMVIRVATLPAGRRVAKVEGPGYLGWAFLKAEMSKETAQQLEEIMQCALDDGGWDQNWDWAAAMMAATQHVRAS